MDIRKIRKLIDIINETGVGEIEVKSGEESVRITCHPHTTHLMPSHPIQPSAQTQPLIQAQPPSPEGQPENTPKDNKENEQTGHTMKSPMVGTVYFSTAPGEPPFVEIGQRVQAGDTICLIEAMKMFNQIEADVSGVVSARLTENEQPVEYDQPLFVIDSD